MLQNSTFPRFSVTLESGDVYCLPIHSSLLRAGHGKAFFVLVYTWWALFRVMCLYSVKVEIRSALLLVKACYFYIGLMYELA